MSQKKVKFNIVDIIVILVLIAGIAFVGVRMLGRQEPADPVPVSRFRVTFYAECVPEAVADTLTPGSVCQDSTRTMALGTLVDHTIGESVAYAADSKGNLTQTTKPGCVSITFTCELTGIRQSTGLQVGENWLNIGHEMGVVCGLTELDAMVLGIAAVE